MEKIEDIVEGWRLYRLTKGKKGDLLLGSIIQRSILIAPRRVNIAKHEDIFENNLPGPCPHKERRCGYNLFKYTGVVDTSIFQHPGAYLGRGYGWGKVIPGEKGFRCQYFYPKSLFGYIPNTPDNILLPEIAPIQSVIGKELWKVARLYKIQLEMELPEWILEENYQQSW